MLGNGRRLVRMSHATAAYLEILERIRCGEVRLGQKLVDVTLAEELKVSRMPVREALLRLVHEGYLVGTTRGFTLPHLDEQDIKDIFEIRRMLEPRAAGIAAQAISDADLELLEAAHKRARAALADHNGFVLMEANTVFRQTWMDAVPNRRLANTLSRFVDHVQTVRNVTLHDELSQEVVMRILDELIVGFRARDTFQVHDSMARFIDQAQERFNALLPQISASRSETDSDEQEPKFNLAQRRRLPRAAGSGLRKRVPGAPS